MCYKSGVPSDLVFLFDFDNTLFDNDGAKTDLAAQVEEAVGSDAAARFWSLYEKVREEQSCINLIDTLQCLVSERPHLAGFPELSAAVLGHPRRDWVYPGAREALANVRQFGETVVMSDGDPLWQPAKIARSGLHSLLDGVLVFAHKEEELGVVQELFPARRYVAVDDKERLLAAIKGILGSRVCTVHVRQGHYGDDVAPTWDGPDMRVQAIGDLQQAHRARFG